MTNKEETFDKNKVLTRNYNALKRIPVAIIVDVSFSMGGELDILNKSLKSLIEKIQSDDLYSQSTDLFLMFYNNTTYIKYDFESINNIDPNDVYIEQCSGTTDTGTALLKALEKCDEKKEMYKNAGGIGTNYVQPKMFLLTDGYPDAGKGASVEEQERVEQNYKKAAAKIKELCNPKNKKLSFFAAGIESKNKNRANIKRLEELTPLVITINEVENNKENDETISKFFEIIYEATFVNKDISGETYYYNDLIRRDETIIPKSAFAKRDTKLNAIYEEITNLN